MMSMSCSLSSCRNCSRSSFIPLFYPIFPFVAIPPEQLQSDIGLSEFIEQIKRELLQDRRTENPLFAIGQVELTISFIVERNANGGVDFTVVQAGVARNTTETQQVKVTLEPLQTPDDVRASLTDVEKSTVKKSVMRGGD